MESDLNIDKAISTLIVDDHAVVRQGIRTFLSLQDDIDVCGEADSGESAIEQVSDLLPDVVLMDLIMPGEIDGIEATRIIKFVSPQTQVIILTSYHEDEHIFPAIKAGALSYILKEIPPAELVNAIRNTAAGEAFMAPQVASRIMAENQDLSSPFIQLSKRELQVLEQVASGKSNAEIAEMLHVGIKTIRAHVSNILSKLHLKDRTQAAVLAWQKGIIRK